MPVGDVGEVEAEADDEQEDSHVDNREDAVEVSGHLGQHHTMITRKQVYRLWLMAARLALQATMVQASKGNLLKRRSGA